MYKQQLSKAILVISLLGPLAAHAALIGPTYPAPGGNNFSSSGGSAGNPGGVTNTYSNFDTSQFSALYWGSDSGFLPTAGLNGTAGLLTFTGISGDVATFMGTTSYTNPTTGISYSSVPTELTVTVTGLGANPWVSFASVNSTDPTGVGAVVNDSSGAQFSATLQFLANVGGSGFQAINTFQQPASPTGLTNSSFNGAFYSAAPVPLPAALWLLVSGLGGLGVFGRRRVAA